MKGTGLSATYARIAQLYGKHGLLGLARRALARLGVRLRFVWRRLAQHRNHVFMHDGAASMAEPLGGLTVNRYASLEEIPDQMLKDLTNALGRRMLENLRAELAGRAVVWVGLIDGDVAGLQMSRVGRHIPEWFIPLRTHDVIIFAIGTVPKCRGRGVAPAMMRQIMATELQGDGRAFIDCRVWNKASIRSIQKAGFRHVATMKPLPARRHVSESSGGS